MRILRKLIWRFYTGRSLVLCYAYAAYVILYAIVLRNWPITVNYFSYIRLWLVNFLLLQLHPLLLLLIVDHALNIREKAYKVSLSISKLYYACVVDDSGDHTRS